MQHRLIIFDGVCNVCNRAVQFIIKHDGQAKFRFTPLQTETAQRLIHQYQVSQNPDTMVLIKDGQTFVKSDAVLEILEDLDGRWYLLRACRFIPRVVRDYCYVVFGRNRYRLFGRRTHCMVPTAELKSRFLPE